MQGQLRVSALLRGAALAGALLLVPPVLAAKAELNAEVPAQKWKALRVRDLPKDATIAVRVDTSGPISVIFVHQGEQPSFPRAVRPAFSGTAERSLSFRITVPVAGTYYVILDNRRGSQARQVRIRIEAVPARPPAAKPPPRTKGLDST